MQVAPVKTNRIAIRSQCLFEVLDRHLHSFEDGSILAITSKLVAVCEGRVAAIEQCDKEALIQRECDWFLPATSNRYRVMLTIKCQRLLPSAGVDESNGDGHYILWPADPQAAANTVRAYLVDRFGCRHAGVLITDSTTGPLRRGVTRIAVANSGFQALRSYVGLPDAFGRPLQMTEANVSEALAAAAVIVMGEGSEKTPLVVLRDLPFVHFQERDPSEEELTALRIALDDDLYASVLRAANWQQAPLLPKASSPSTQNR